MHSIHSFSDFLLYIAIVDGTVTTSVAGLLVLKKFFICLYSKDYDVSLVSREKTYERARTFFILSYYYSLIRKGTEKNGSNSKMKQKPVLEKSCRLETEWLTIAYFQGIQDIFLIHRVL